ncbi:hypothetical protein J6590_037338 [Homalodisca vitripennis]|nr:hypothetical protein J6590_037338 [Homalodisca vitripennis]
MIHSMNENQVGADYAAPYYTACSKLATCAVWVANGVNAGAREFPIADVSLTLREPGSGLGTDSDNETSVNSLPTTVHSELFEN